MSHQVVLEPTASCAHAEVHEYWHENEFCSLDSCAVIECESCELFATECEAN